MFRDNGNVLYFDSGGSFTGTYICQKQSNSILQIGDSFACTLYPNKVDFLKTLALECEVFYSCLSPMNPISSLGLSSWEQDPTLYSLYIPPNAQHRNPVLKEITSE